jgi:signal transduction histidine kinase
MPLTPPERRHLLAVLLPVVAATVLLVAVCVVGLQVASVVRAIVGGESLWSKGRAEAVARLRAYAVGGDAADYRHFLAALEAPSSNQRARLELERPHPDDARAAAALLAAGNAPEDVPGLVLGYQALHHLSVMREPLDIWREGDRLIEQLRSLGMRLQEHHGASPGAPPPAALMEDLQVLNDQLLVAEKRFSESLGHASRSITAQLIGTSIVLGAAVALACVWLVRRSLQAQMADQRALAEANRRWELAAEADGLGVFEWQVTGDRLILDARGRRVYGLPPDGHGPERPDVPGLHHPADAEAVRQAVAEALRSGGTLRVRYRVRDAATGWRHVEATGQVRGGPRPEDARLVGVVRDITAELAQAQLRADKELAERTDAARRVFLSRLSHELRTPLNAILGLAHLLAVDTRERLTTQQARRVKLLTDSARSLLRLVEDVLDITEIDADTPSVADVETDLVDILRACLPLVENERALRDVRILARLPEHPVRVMGDARRLQQVFVQLLGNACKFNRPAGEVSVSVADRGQEVAVAVADQGRGLSPEEQAELFQAFRRFSPEPDVPGSGVGLLMAKMLVDQMKGRIEVNSCIGEGSCFTVVLRAA